MTTGGDGTARRIALATTLVRDDDGALAFFTGPLGFAVAEDRSLDGACDTAGKRWVTVMPAGGRARGSSPETADFARDHAAFRARGVRFAEAPRREPYGTVAVFADLDGNPRDLIQLDPG